MSGHTPGPWKFEPNEYGSIVCKDGKSMVAVWPQALDGQEFPHEANARLIAAAPELLEVLVGLSPYLEAIVCYASTMREHHPNRLAVNARAAIAKATGAAP